LGGAPLFYNLGGRSIAFATDYSGLFALPDLPRTLDEAALGDFLVLNHRRSEETLYAGVRRVPSGAMAIVEDGAPRLDQHWAPGTRATARRGGRAEWVQEARHLLDQAAAARLRSLTPAAAETSGGLDSSAVAATAARLLAPARLHALTLLPPPDVSVRPLRGHYADEHDKVAALGRMHANLDVEFLAPTAPHPNETDPRRMFALAGAPVRNPINYGWFAHLRDRAAETGHRVLLTGQDTARLARIVRAWPQSAEPASRPSYASMIAMDRALHLGPFIPWVEGANDQTNCAPCRAMGWSGC